MAIQRHLHNLRSRPHHERRAIAAMVSLGVVAVLGVVYVVIFFSTLNAATRVQNAAIQERNQEAIAAESQAQQTQGTQDNQSVSTTNIQSPQQLQTIEVTSQ